MKNSPYLPRLLAFLSVALVAACHGRGDVAGESALARIRREGRVRVGFANEAPYAYIDSESGKLTGEAPEIARRVLDAMGIEEMEPVLTEFGSLIPGLKAGRFDLIAAGMYITPARCREIAFSEPTYGIGEAFLVLQGNPKNLHGYADVVENERAVLGVVGGTVEVGYARAVGVPDERLVIFPDPPSAVAGVLAGRADAFAGTALTVQDLLSKSDAARLERATPFSDPVIDGRPARGYGAFGFRKEDGTLLEAFNERLGAFIGSEAHLEAVAPFGFTAGEFPGGMSAARLCGRRGD